MKTTLIFLLAVFCLSQTILTETDPLGVSIQLDSAEEIYDLPAESNDFYITGLSTSNKVYARVTSDDAKKQIDALFNERAVYEVS